MIEINIQIEESADDEVLIRMLGSAEGDTYSTAEADTADVIAEAVKAVQFPGKEAEIKQDVHYRVGR